MRHTRVLFTFVLFLSGLLFCLRPAAADSVFPPASASASVRVAKPESDLPAVLSHADETLYRRIFRLNAAGDWTTVDRLIGKLDDPLLVGHVLSQRYLSRGSYRARPDELAAWLSRYRDLPEASQVSSLLRSKTRKRGQRPAARLSSPSDFDTVGETMPPVTVYEAHDEHETTVTSLQLAGEIRALLETGATAAAQNLLASPRAQRQLSADDTISLAGEIDQAVTDGGYCSGWADGCSVASSDSDAAWAAGLTAWRNEDYAEAIRNFELVATRSERSPWLASAGAFWAARAHLVGGEPQSVTKWLTAAAAFPRTFYGILARRIVGLPMPFEWSLNEHDRAALAALADYEAGRRALALVQVGQNERAAETLRALAANVPDDLLHGIMVAADRSGAAHLALQLQHRLLPNGGYDSAAYPVPHWVPEGDFSADRALIYAVIRQESGFEPRAVSRAGARGVMQLMPGTARLVARRIGSDDARRWADPAVNIKLGQSYIEMLMSDSNVDGDLFRFCVAWNAGPGNLERWLGSSAATDDPLLFIELIPLRETRDFIERVLANLWIYRDRLGQIDPSLDALAAGDRPTYVAVDHADIYIARRGEP